MSNPYHSSEAYHIEMKSIGHRLNALNEFRRWMVDEKNEANELGAYDLAQYFSKCLRKLDDLLSED